MIDKQYDFRGGYSSSLPPELMPDNVVVTGTNVYWKGKLIGRPSWQNLSSDATINTSGNSVVGAVRAYMNSTWQNIIAIDDGSDVQFYLGDTGNYTVIQDESSATYSMTTGHNVEMRYINNVVLAVNGTDKPAIIYYDSAYIAKDLEQYDVRTRGNDEWYAGLWDDGASPPFVDDTTDAQSDTADDFKIATGGTNNDGFYVSGVTVFNKIIIVNCPAFDGSPVAEYAYYAGNDTWTTVTPATTPNYGAAEANKTIEFDLPFDSAGELLWKQYGDLTTQSDPDLVPGGALNRFIFRIRFTTAPTSDQSADKLEIYNTQYLSQIFLNDKPNAIEIHKNRVFLAAGNAFRFSPPNQVTGWDSRDIEYCSEGGTKITTLVSAGDFLAIFKDAAIYRYYGTTTENFVLRSKPSPGCPSARGAAFLGNIVMYAARDGIRVISGEENIRVTRHIQSDYDSWTKTDAVVASWDGNAVISFPTNDVMLWVDPDTVSGSEVDAGEGRLAFWKWTGLSTTVMYYANGSGDNQYFIAYDDANRRIVRSGTNGYDTSFDGTQVAITNTLQTKYKSYNAPGQKKRYTRVKIELSKSGDWTLTMLSDNGDSTASATVSSGTGSGHYITYESLPYELDGYNLSFKLVNATTNAVEVYGMSVESLGRAF